LTAVILGAQEDPAHRPKGLRLEHDEGRAVASGTPQRRETWWRRRPASSGLSTGWR